MSSIISISIDCSQIDKSRLKDGKYLNFTVSKRKEVGQYGDTHSLTYNQTKEEREAKKPKQYLKGTAKEFVFKDTQNQPQQNAKQHIDNVIGGSSSITDEEDDLPF